MFKKSKSYREDWECYESLTNACLAARNALDVPQDDLRFQNLNNIEKITGMTMMLLNTLINCEEARLPETLPNFLKFLGFTDLQGGLSMLKPMAKYLKLSHIVHSQFQIEYLMHRLNQAIDGPNKDRGFKDIAGRLVKTFKLGGATFEQLMVPAYIRNSLHNAGINHNRDFNVEINGVTFACKKGEDFNCATRPHCAHAIENSIDVLSQVLQLPAVTALPIIRRLEPSQLEPA